MPNNSDDGDKNDNSSNDSDASSNEEAVDAGASLAVNDPVSRTKRVKT